LQKKSQTMKKFLALAAVVVALASCKKDYTCECTATILGVTDTETLTFEDATKAEAEDSCNTANTAYQLFGGSCELQ
jgi:hypothetical protein